MDPKVWGKLLTHHRKRNKVDVEALPGRIPLRQNTGKGLQMRSVTPKILALFSFIKMLPGNKTFPIVKFYLLWFWICASCGKNLQRYCWTWFLSTIKQLFISGFKFSTFLFSDLYLFKNICNVFVWLFWLMPIV